MQNRTSLFVIALAIAALFLTTVSAAPAKEQTVTLAITGMT